MQVERGSQLVEATLRPGPAVSCSTSRCPGSMGSPQPRSRITTFLMPGADPDCARLPWLRGTVVRGKVVGLLRASGRSIPNCCSRPDAKARALTARVEVLRLRVDVPPRKGRPLPPSQLGTARNSREGGMRA